MPKKKEIEPKKPQYYYAVGRRKEAVAQVRLYPHGDGTIIVNDKPIEQYFPGQINRLLYLEPFRTTNTLKGFNVTVKVNGSGTSGQLGAVIHGISRALVLVDPDKNRSVLRHRGFLTRDPRVKERRKVGQMGKARKKKQSPKR